MLCNNKKNCKDHGSLQNTIIILKIKKNARIDTFHNMFSTTLDFGPINVAGDNKKTAYDSTLGNEKKGIVDIFFSQNLKKKTKNALYRNILVFE